MFVAQKRLKKVLLLKLQRLLKLLEQIYIKHTMFI